MYDAPDGIKQALDNLISAAEQEKLVLAVLVLENDGTDEGGMRRSTEGEAGAGRAGARTRSEAPTNAEEDTGMVATAATHDQRASAGPSMPTQRDVASSSSFVAKEAGDDRGQHETPEQTIASHDSQGPLLARAAKEPAGETPKDVQTFGVAHERVSTTSDGRDQTATSLGASQGTTPTSAATAIGQSEAHAGREAQGLLDEPMILVLPKSETARIRSYVRSTIGRRPGLSEERELSARPKRLSIRHSPVDEERNRALSSSAKRSSFHIPSESHSQKRTRVTESEHFRSPRPVSMPSIHEISRQEGSLAPGPMSYERSTSRAEGGEQTEFWGTVMQRNVEGSRMLPDREVAKSPSLFHTARARFRSVFQQHVDEQFADPRKPSTTLDDPREALGTGSPGASSRIHSTAPASRDQDREVSPRAGFMQRPSQVIEGRHSRARSEESHGTLGQLESFSSRGETGSMDMDPMQGHRHDTIAGRQQPEPVQGYAHSEPGSVEYATLPSESPQLQRRPAAPAFPRRPQSFSGLAPLGRGEYRSLPPRQPPTPLAGASPRLEHRHRGETGSISHLPRALPSVAELQQPDIQAQQRAGRLPPPRNIYPHEERGPILQGPGRPDDVPGLPRRASAPSGTVPMLRPTSRQEPRRMVVPPSGDLAREAMAQPGDTGRSLAVGLSPGSGVTQFSVPVRGQGAHPFACPQCDATFRRRSDMNRHIRVVHEKRRPFECPKCNNKFGEKSNMIKHVRMVHENIRTFKCKYCDAAFGQRGNCDAHVRAVHEKRPGKYTCDICRRAFSRKAQLLDHYGQEHPGQPIPVSRTRSRAGPSSMTGVVSTSPGQPGPSSLPGGAQGDARGSLGGPAADVPGHISEAPLSVRGAMGAESEMRGHTQRPPVTTGGFPGTSGQNVPESPQDPAQLTHIRHGSSRYRMHPK